MVFKLILLTSMILGVISIITLICYSIYMLLKNLIVKQKVRKRKLIIIKKNKIILKAYG